MEQEQQDVEQRDLGQHPNASEVQDSFLPVADASIEAQQSAESDRPPSRLSWHDEPESGNAVLSDGQLPPRAFAFKLCDNGFNIFHDRSTFRNEQSKRRSSKDKAQPSSALCNEIHIDSEDIVADETGHREQISFASLDLLTPQAFDWDEDADNIFAAEYTPGSVANMYGTTPTEESSSSSSETDNDDVADVSAEVDIQRSSDENTQNELESRKKEAAAVRLVSHRETLNDDLRGQGRPIVQHPTITPQEKAIVLRLRREYEIRHFTWQQALSEYEEEVARLTQDNNALKSQRQSLGSQMRRMSILTAESQKRAATLEEERDAAEDRTAGAEDELERLKTQLITASKDLQAAEEKLKQAEAEGQGIKEQLADAETRADKFNLEIGGHLVAIDTLEAELNEIKIDVFSLNQSKDQLSKRNKQLQKDNTELKRRVSFAKTAKEPVRTFANFLSTVPGSSSSAKGKQPEWSTEPSSSSRALSTTHTYPSISTSPASPTAPSTRINDLHNENASLRNSIESLRNERLELSEAHIRCAELTQELSTLRAAPRPQPEPRRQEQKQTATAGTQTTAPIALDDDDDDDAASAPTTVLAHDASSPATCPDDGRPQSLDSLEQIRSVNSVLYAENMGMRDRLARLGVTQLMTHVRTRRVAAGRALVRTEVDAGHGWDVVGGDDEPLTLQAKVLRAQAQHDARLRRIWALREEGRGAVERRHEGVMSTGGDLRTEWRRKFGVRF